MHNPASATAGGVATQQQQDFVARYGMVFVWHAASAAFAWCVLAPLGFAWMRATRRAGGDDVFRGHRFIMLSVVGLTIQAWLVAVAYEHNTPPVHALLGSIVLLLALVQVTIGAMRPSVDAGSSRSLWTGAHRIIATSVFIVAAYLCHHSIYVFNITLIPAAIIHSCLIFSILAISVAELAPLSFVKRLTGQRAGYFENNGLGEHHHLQKVVQDDPLGSGVGFRVVEDDSFEVNNDNQVDEESALSLMPDQGNTTANVNTTEAASNRTTTTT